MQKTKIIATLGPSTADAVVMEEMLNAGVDLFRINGAHGTQDDHRAQIRTIRKLEQKRQEPVAILLDLPGPKLRLGDMLAERILRKGEIVTLQYGLKQRDQEIIPVANHAVLRAAEVGTKIFINDGLVQLRVTEKDGEILQCRVSAGGPISSRKGINMPGAKLRLSPVGPLEKQLVKLAVEEGVDYLGLSFVRVAQDIYSLRALVKKHEGDIGIVAKIERVDAVENIEGIFEAADGIMVARGDLGIELPLEQVPGVQYRLVQLARVYRKPVIIATQMLESMITAARPTRAEVTDVSAAVSSGADAIMLSAETSVGRDPVRVVRTMHRIASEAEKVVQVPPLPAAVGGESILESIAKTAVVLAESVNAHAIMTPTTTGEAARFVSKYSHHLEILAPTRGVAVARRVCLFRAVRSFLVDVDTSNPAKFLDAAERIALRNGWVKHGETIVAAGVAERGRKERARLIELRHVDGTMSLDANDVGTTSS